MWLRRAPRTRFAEKLPPSSDRACGIPCVMSPISEAPASVAVLVVDRWNSWVQVLFPETGETTWLDLSETPYQPLSAAEHQGPGPRARGARQG